MTVHANKNFNLLSASLSSLLMVELLRTRPCSHYTVFVSYLRLDEPQTVVSKPKYLPTQCHNLEDHIMKSLCREKFEFLFLKG
jgi:hypothetical protein